MSEVAASKQSYQTQLSSNLYAHRKKKRGGEGERKRERESKREWERESERERESKREREGY